MTREQAQELIRRSRLQKTASVLDVPARTRGGTLAYNTLKGGEKPWLGNFLNRYFVRPAGALAGGAGKLALGAGAVATAPLTLPVRAAWRTVMPGGVRQAGQEVLGIGARAPLTTAFTLGAAGFGISQMDPDVVRQTAASQRMAQYMGTAPQPEMVKMSSREDLLKRVREARERRGLTKTASEQPAPIRDARDVLSPVTPEEAFRRMAVRMTTPEELEKLANVRQKLAEGAKKASSLTTADAVRLGIGFGVASALAGVAQNLATVGTGIAGEKISKASQGKRFQAMLEQDPSLLESGYDMKEVRRFFNVVDNASPYIGNEPIFAANFVRTMLDAPREGNAPQLRGDFAKSLLDTETSRQRARFPWQQSGSTPKLAIDPKIPVG